MTSSKNTKRALLASVLSVMLCCAMLVGSTFAWFTDSITSGRNQIVAGNLDVQLQYKTPGGAYADVTSTTQLFDQDALWEPGHVEVINLKVSNEGTLALKYTLSMNIFKETESINVNNEVFKLSDHLRYAVLDGAAEYAQNSEGRAATIQAAESADHRYLALTDYQVTDKPLYPKDDPTGVSQQEFTIIVYMPTTVGNEANYKTGATPPSIELGVNLLATQYTYEPDSFGSDYDADAEYYYVNTSAPIVNNSGTLGEDVVITGQLPRGTVTVTVRQGAALADAEVQNLTLQIKNVSAERLEYYEMAADIYERDIYLLYDVQVVGVGDRANVTFSWQLEPGLNGVMTFPENNGYDSETGVFLYSGNYVNSSSNREVLVLYENPDPVASVITSAVEALDENGGTVTIPAAEDISINSILEAASGKNNVIIQGSGIGQTNATVLGSGTVADNFTLSDMSISGVFGVTGDGTTLENLDVTGSIPSIGLADYTATITGSDTTVKASTFTGGRRAALFFYDSSDTSESVTTIDGCVFQDSTYDLGGSVSQIRTGIGIRFYGFYGTVNITDTTFDLAQNAFWLGPINSVFRGVLNVSDSTLNAGGATISTVQTASLTNVTFDNTRGSKMDLDVGAANTTFESCTFNTKIAFGSPNFGNKSVQITFNNCKDSSGTQITADNYTNYFDFSALSNRDTLTVIIDGTTVLDKA